MSRWTLLRAIGFGALTYFLLRYTINKHFVLYNLIPVILLAGLVVNELFISKRKKRMPPKR